MDLVIVESPAKAKTIEKYLGSGVRVLASYGHVRDLPAKDGSVDPDDGFAMRWEVSDGRSREQVKAIVAAARSADRVILATDPDREGEAISWHLAELLTAKKAVPGGGLSRITFNAVTKDAVEAAMAAPRQVDQALVDAYLARRALDYLVGFTLSPVLWRKLPGAKSAGRVQSVSLRLIVEREREIEAFVPREYWTVDAAMETAAGVGFPARLTLLDGRKLDKFALATEAQAEAARARVAQSAFTVAAVEVKDAVRNPAPPFTTSTLQQEAARKLGMGAKTAMDVAQRLYESGHISYMRTDGVSMDGSAIAAARAVAADQFGADHVPAAPRKYSAKAKNAQEAHEGIRPTNFSARAQQLGLDGEQARLYDLVWKRAVASQMASARLERTAIDLLSADGSVGLRATGTVIAFAGFLALYAEGADDSEDEDGARLPKLAAGEQPALKEALKAQHFTQPPPRYSEASLVKRMEELGIGRPSTYASIIEVLKARDYVRLEQKRFRPEDKGRLVTAFLERFFTRYVDYGFTAGLEEDLDRISAGEREYQEVLRAFWEDFQPRTADVLEQKPWDVDKALDEHLAAHLFPDRGDGVDPRACPSCDGGRLALRVGRFGPFISCSNYPECKYRRAFAGEGEDAGPQTLGDDPATGLPVEVKSGRFGRYIQSGEKRSSIPKTFEPIGLERALMLLTLPRELGPHPETGLPIVANLGRYGPYLLHDGKYANLKEAEDLFGIGMNAAVVKLAEPKFGRARASVEPLAMLGANPDGAEVKVMAGRFGPYVTDGSVNATLPKAVDPAALTLDEALVLLAEKAAKGPAKGKKKAAKKPAANKPPTKKAVAKKAVAEKPAAKKTAKKAAL